MRLTHRHGRQRRPLRARFSPRPCSRCVRFAARQARARQSRVRRHADAGTFLDAAAPGVAAGSSPTGIVVPRPGLRERDSRRLVGWRVGLRGHGDRERLVGRRLGLRGHGDRERWVGRRRHRGIRRRGLTAERGRRPATPTLSRRERIRRPERYAGAKLRNPSYLLSDMLHPRAFRRKADDPVLSGRYIRGANWGKQASGGRARWRARPAGSKPGVVAPCLQDRDLALLAVKASGRIDRC